MDRHVDVKDLIGRKFVNGGRDVIKGLDCWGLVMEVFKRYGIEIPDFTVDAFSYAAVDALTKKAKGSHLWEEVYTPWDKEAPLVVLMRMHPKLITHAGVFIGDNRIIHTMASTGTITSRMDVLANRITGYYRLCSR